MALPRTMQRYGPPGLPPADGRPAFLGNPTSEVIWSSGPQMATVVDILNRMRECLRHCRAHGQGDL
jgi:hypothetical protein